MAPALSLVLPEFHQLNHLFQLIICRSIDPVKAEDYSVNKRKDILTGFLLLDMPLDHTLTYPRILGFMYSPSGISHSTTMQARAYMSHITLPSNQGALSGWYPGVPLVPVLQLFVAGRALSKSIRATFIGRPRLRTMFSGFRSRWTKPIRCSSFSPATT